MTITLTLDIWLITNIEVTSNDAHYLGECPELIAWKNYQPSVKGRINIILVDADTALLQVQGDASQVRYSSCVAT